MAARASGSGESLTGMLQAWAKGDLEARDRLLPVVYGELRRQAARELRGERAGHTRPSAGGRLRFFGGLSRPPSSSTCVGVDPVPKL